MQNHIDLAKSKSKELESGFHAMKLGGLRFNLIQNAKHHFNLKNRIRFQIGIISEFCLFCVRRSNLHRKRSHVIAIIFET